MKEEEHAQLDAVELTIEGIIGFAMRSEHEARQFYLQAAKVAPASEQRELLLGLSKQEAGHLVQLVGLFRGRYPESYEKVVRETSPADFSATGPEAEADLLKDMSLLEIVTIAAWEEMKALRFYRASAREWATDGVLSEMLSNLAEQEEAHLEALKELRMILEVG